MTKPPPWLAGLLCLGLAGVAQAQAAHRHPGPSAEPWTDQPRLEKLRGFNRSMALLRPVGLRIDEATVLPSVAAGEPSVRSRVPLRDGKLVVRSLSPRQGGYYRIAAMQPVGDGARIASTVVYFSNPGPAPRAMLAAAAMPLEIVPVRLPREHRHYRVGETWAFALRRDGRPLPDHPVRFESDQGTALTLHSDANGLVQLTFPDDLPPVEERDRKAGHRGGPRSAFVLSANWGDPGGRELHTAFNYHYRPGAYAGKDLWLGGGFAVLGMLAAAPLLRRRKAKEAAR